MLTIRDAQLEIFRGARVEGFIRSLVAYLTGEYPAHCARLGSDGTRAMVERSLEAARPLGIRNEGALGVFVELRLVYGDNLERAPDREWARNILAHRTLPDYIKVGAVQDRLSERTGGRVLVMHHESS
jgi:hypothetical protein